MKQFRSSAAFVVTAALALPLALPSNAGAQTSPEGARPPVGMPGGERSQGGDHGGGRGGDKALRMHGGPGMMMPGMETHMLMRMADELALSPEQRQTIRGFFSSAQPGFQKLHEQMRANTKLMLDTQPDDPKYQTVVQQVSQSSAELAQQMVLQSSQLRTQVYSVLTPEQKTKLKARQSEMQARWEERRAERQAVRRDAAPERAKAVK
jgi:Spy/CpxP family protein refolding chaperone